MEKRQWKFIVRHGQMVPPVASQEIRDTLKMYENRRVVLTLEPPPRSIAANAYYWGVVIATIHEAMLDAGICTHSAEKIHEEFRDLYLPVIAGVWRTRRPSTADLNQDEFHRYIERIKFDEFVLSLGCHIPEPEAPIVGSAIYEP